ncbi:Predicted protein [Taphrina deformans PYCC 5710]|uniref:Queuosine 5'-phosphate N-glycosylase/hydrolase n=1 Tax=Taphrina deformans (strain PYCC 5710 / ATCC 11124 / CBS 356.35 / IMI 108563 / JCM 9778 / NBRC 8474) TaxID=1097556 RepID=R4XE45_TAPDE|nr:Predicted protein [Taphrina deformans PYCC 5710]|eukprot:CCG82710.1 Predicted protein [Taphrina deformans PYCC 5710]
MTFPLRFESDHQRWNFYSIMHLLNFGSGYRVILKAANGSGAFDNIIKLLIAAHISGHALDAAWMRRVDASDVGEMMHISMVQEIPVPGNPILKQVEPSPAAALVHKITDALNSTGKRLQELGNHLYLIDYVRHCAETSRDIDTLLNKLAQLPVLDDRAELDDGTQVFIYKKMQVMISELIRNGLPFSCVGPGDLTIFSDNVIPTMLQHYKLISCPSADVALRSDMEITSVQALSVRAASIVVCRDIVHVAQSKGLSWIGDEIDLDNYLWKVAKEGDLRKLPRYADRATWFY